MSTRGLWGYVIGDELKVTYNHSDSYPKWLGVHLLAFLRENGPEQLRPKAAALALVDEDAPPTPEQIDQLGRFANTSVSSGKPAEWYVLLRETQGDPAATFEAGAMIDGREFAADSLFCEWAYVVDLDGERLEVYRGFQQEAHDQGRFAAMDGYDSNVNGHYYPVKLIGAWSLRELPSDEAFCAALSEDDDA